MKRIPLAAARPRIAEIIGRNVHHDDWGPAPEHGYSAVATTTADASTRRMSLSVDAWGRLGEGNVELMAGGIMVPLRSGDRDLSVVSGGSFGHS